MERDDPLPGRLDELLAELDRLGQDDLFLGGQEGDLADLLEVHPDRVVDPDHVGARSLRAPPRSAPRAPWRRASPARRAALTSMLAVLADDVDAHVDRRPRRTPRASAESRSSSSSSSSSSATPAGTAVLIARMFASRASSRSSLPALGRLRTASTRSLSVGIDGHDLPPIERAGEERCVWLPARSRSSERRASWSGVPGRGAGRIGVGVAAELRVGLFGLRVGESGRSSSWSCSRVMRQLVDGVDDPRRAGARPGRGPARAYRAMRERPGLGVERIEQRAADERDRVGLHAGLAVEPALVEDRRVELAGDGRRELQSGVSSAIATRACWSGTSSMSRSSSCSTGVIERTTSSGLTCSWAARTASSVSRTPP